MGKFITSINFIFSLSSNSDGMGRSGVFICAMSEVERVKVEGQVDVFQTIKGMRIQRPHMVETAVSVYGGECVPERMCTMSYDVHIIVYIINMYKNMLYIC